MSALPTAAVPADESGTARMVVAELADGHVHSGQDLANSLGLTRAAVWKQVRQLRAHGLPVAAVPGRGYQLPWPVELLHEERIRAAMPAECRRAMADLQIAWRPGSTSEVLRQRARSLGLAPSVLLAESQSAGRGRRGRTWLAPPCANICLSLGLRFDCGAVGLAGLSLAAGVMVLRALTDTGFHQAGLKWPNDILAAGGKLAGVLTEIEGEYSGPSTVILGLGLNLHLTEKMRAAAAQPVAELQSLMPEQRVSRNVLAAALIAHLIRGLEQFRQHGFAAFAGEYARHDLLRGAPLRITTAQDEWYGQGAGVDAQGALLVQSDAGLVRVDSAEVSVRTA